MATRAQLQTQLATVVARIAETQAGIDAAGFEARQELEGQMALLQGRAQALRQQIAIMPDEEGFAAVAAVKAKPPAKKAAAKTKKARVKRGRA